MTAADVTDALERALEIAVRRYHCATEDAVVALEEATAAAVAALDAGVVSERSVSDSFGLDRNTIRAWRGKGRIR